MSQQLVVQELGIIIANREQQNPQVLNPDFLKYSGIIPRDWELARAPIYTPEAVQLTYTNSISIIAEPNRVLFLEAIEGKIATEIVVPGIARKYVEILSNVEYEAVGINPRGYAPFSKQSPDAARSYITTTLLSGGAWQEQGTAPMRATLNLVYKRERGSLYLSVSEAALRNQDEETATPIVLFSGSFSYELAGSTSAQRLGSLLQSMENWQDDLQAYKDMINTKFLSHAVASNSGIIDTTTLPDVFAMSTAAV